jgi:uncharacterized protein with NAD-binding domain and iron-sulfur cluster
VTRRRVLIVGGGLAGLSAAYELSRTPALREQWQVEVVEMGHRLGGRLASAHRPEKSGRNEEHGLHVWFGFYDNAFRLADDVWRAYERPANSPWRSIDDALRPIHFGDFALPHEGSYSIRRAYYPRNADAPGRATRVSWTGRITGLLDAWRALPLTLLSYVREAGRAPIEPGRSTGPTRSAVVRSVEALIAPLLEQIAALGLPSALPARRALSGRIEALIASVHQPIVRTAKSAAGQELGALELARSFDLFLAMMRGVASPEHGILEDGDLDAVSEWELSDWLRHHGASEDSVAHSRFLETLYDAPFCYRDGDRRRRVFEASTALRLAFRTMFGYKHGVAYLLNGGAGEALVAPLFHVLARRDVRFRLFHRLDRLQLDGARRRVQRLTFKRAARVRGRYDPLVTRGGLRGLRAEPDWAQLEEGEALRARGVDFYSRFADRGEEDEVALELGRDYDDVILALPLGCILPDGSGHTPVRAWLDAHPPAQLSLERLHLVPTVAAQLWFRGTPQAAGIEERALVAWAPPFSILCDMSPVIAHEDWAQPAPGACAYLCGAAPLAAHRAPSGDGASKDRDLARANRELDAQLDAHGHTLSGKGPAPTAAQQVVDRYVRVNVEPWDLADLSLPGADAVRLDAGDSGLDNLSLAGSWVRTSMNTTSLEAAVSSGVAAARALGARVRPVLGEGWLGKPSRAPVLPGRTLEVDDDEP